MNGQDFEKTVQLGNLQSDCSERKKEREKTKITNIRNERGNITKDSTDINKIIKENHEQLYTNKFPN